MLTSNFVYKLLINSLIFYSLLTLDMHYNAISLFSKRSIFRRLTTILFTSISILFTSILLLSFVSYSGLNYGKDLMRLHEAEAAQSCSNLSISGTKASGSESTNPPAHAIDNDISTRWSNLGLPSWIQLDLGDQKTICSVTIAWHRGDERQNTFEISISNDGSSYKSIFSDMSRRHYNWGRKI